MKIFALVGTVSLLLIMTTAPLRAQDREDQRIPDNSAQPQDQRGMKNQRGPQDDKNRDQSQEERNRNQQPEPRSARPDERRSDQERAPEPERNQREARPETARPDEQRREPAQTYRNEQRPRSTERGRRIPDDRFRAEFGPQHRFHVQRSEIINHQHPVFMYGGYRFELAEPWPSEWSYDDDCYIDYTDDGYYLFDPLHPGIRVTLIVID